MVLNANVGSLNSTPVGDTYRGFGASLFNNRNIAREDFMRAEQSADNQLARDLYLSQYVNDFNASEAQKARDFNASEAQKTREHDEYMSSSAYTRAVADLKKAGLNPILAYSQGGASTPSSSQATSSQATGSASRSSAHGAKGSVADTQGLLSVLAGLLVGTGSLIRGVSALSAVKSAKKFKVGFGD